MKSDSELDAELDDYTDDYMAHYGTPRHSGRYPWGSGDDPYQHTTYGGTKVRHPGSGKSKAEEKQPIDIYLKDAKDKKKGFMLGQSSTILMTGQRHSISYTMNCIIHNRIKRSPYN